MGSKLLRGVDRPNREMVPHNAVFAAIAFKNLGQECWSPMRLRKCVGCHRYDTCTYNVKQHDDEYDRLRAVSNRKKEEAAVALKAAQDYWDGLTLPK